MDYHKGFCKFLLVKQNPLYFIKQKQIWLNKILEEVKMGIHSQFNFGIKLYTFSFAFSNLKRGRIEDKEEIDSKSSSSGFLSAFTKDMFFLKNVKVQKQMQGKWAFTCL